ncbi:YeeE/YedE family protein [Acinetobacter qingfengensis]|uniref:YeeE/YedE family protein n=1 Tax=Acinetobacter qingfengensis TaxID=1262585 RepID=A0A1E7RCJ1_9GAMM|nr:DUF6691 family protein [Acinetobacter qingfengensis]KAA8734843.1 YeeE/YedE family protein [Acinetobacter qingfengensis]OEY96885.1 YeeE/YedE family protein [Acinetobacter qingfengensis]
MKKNLLAFLFGGCFALGLLLSGMSNPAIVLSFFDIFGHWNPQLMFVMGGAVLVAFFPFQWALKQQSYTIFAEKIILPNKTKVDSKLVIGAIIFGVGWGLSGICPAPGLTLMGLLQPTVLYFVIPMLVTIWCYDRLQ